VLIKTDDMLSGKYGKPHFVRFYDEDDVLLDEVAAFLDQACGADGTGIVIATPGATIALLRRRSAQAAPCASADLAGCRCRAGGFMVDGWPDRQRFEAAVGGRVAAACAGGATRACVRRNGGAAVRARPVRSGAAARGVVERPGAALRLLAVLRLPVERLFPSPDLANAFQRVCAEHDHACADTAMALPDEGDVDIGLHPARAEGAGAARRGAPAGDR
jgi:hypothetical protein